MLHLVLRDMEQDEKGKNEIRNRGKRSASPC